MKRPLSSIAIFVCLLLCYVVFSGATPSQKDQEHDKAKAAMEEAVKRDEVPISFYGKVIDQDGQPVADAQVRISITHYSLNGPLPGLGLKTIMVKTNQDGFFEIENGRGWEVNISRIVKDGYEFTPLDMKRSGHGDPFMYGSKYVNPHIPDKSKPVVYRIHKIGPTAFLLMGNGQLVVRPDEKVVVGEISKDRLFYNPNYYTDRRDNSEKFPGFAVSGTLAKDTRDWVLTFKGKHPNDTVILLNDFVYQAPENGYQPSAELKASLQPSDVPGREPQYPGRLEACLIVRSGNPVTYTRVNLEIYLRDANRCDISYDMTLNPYGVRTFELDKRTHDKEGRISSILGVQAIQALCNGQLPPKPDIDKLIEQAKAEEEAKQKSESH